VDIFEVYSQCLLPKQTFLTIVFIGGFEKQRERVLNWNHSETFPRFEGEAECYLY
jgi:hypothetical protein